jgi:hypothetical protein
MNLRRLSMLNKHFFCLLIFTSQVKNIYKKEELSKALKWYL